MNLSGCLVVGEEFVGRVRITGDPHDPEVDDVRIVRLTEVLLELGGDEPDVVVVIGCYQDVR